MEIEKIFLTTLPKFRYRLKLYRKFELAVVTLTAKIHVSAYKHFFYHPDRTYSDAVAKAKSTI